MMPPLEVRRCAKHASREPITLVVDFFSFSPSVLTSIRAILRRVFLPARRSVAVSKQASRQDTLVIPSSILRPLTSSSIKPSSNMSASTLPSPPLTPTKRKATSPESYFSPPTSAMASSSLFSPSPTNPTPGPEKLPPLPRDIKLPPLPKISDTALEKLAFTHSSYHGRQKDRHGLDLTVEHTDNEKLEHVGDSLLGTSGLLSCDPSSWDRMCCDAASASALPQSRGRHGDRKSSR